MPAPFTSDTIQIGGDTRHFHHYISPNLIFPAPLCVVLHGGGQLLSGMLDKLEMSGTIPAVDPPYVVLAPQGAGKDPKTNTIITNPDRGVWNSGHSPGGQAAGMDDVAFITTLIDQTIKKMNTAGTPIDSKKIYAIGFSNGGMMAYRLAAERSDLFAAICSIAGTIGGRPTPTSTPHVNNPLKLGTAEPVSLFHIHGLVDATVSPFGGHSPKADSTRVDRNLFNSVNAWVQHNDCNRIPTVSDIPGGTGTTCCFTNGTNNTEVTLTTLNQLGHKIPPNVVTRINTFLLNHPKS